MKTTSDVISTSINNVTVKMKGCSWNAEEWEQIRAAWIELGIQIAGSKAADVENVDSYTTLEQVQIDNFDDAMKVLK